MTLTATHPLPAADTRFGLRERKKRQTRLALHRAALEVARDAGVDATTVEAIVDRVGVSARTFFNYFPTKDDALVGFDPDVIERLRAQLSERPATESTTRAIRVVMTGHVRDLQDQGEIWKLRRQVAMTNPQISARMLGSGVALDRALVDAAVARSGRSDHDTLAVVVEAYAAVGAFRAAAREHVLADFEGQVAERVDRAFACLPYPS